MVRTRSKKAQAEEQNEPTLSKPKGQKRPSDNEVAVSDSTPDISAADETSATHTSKKHKGKAKVETLDMDESIDSDDDEEDSIDWETIQLPRRLEEPIMEQDTYGDVEIVMEAPRPILKKSHWEMAYQRHLRDWTHNAHVMLLIAHYSLRNIWCSRDETMSVCKSVIPDHAKNLLFKESTQADLILGIKWLMTWWHEYFTLTGKGLLTRPYSYFSHIKSLKTLIDKHESNEEVDHIENFETFLELFSLKAGTRDTSAELFVALLRACGCETRLVCSLQPISYKPPVVAKKETKVDNDNEDEDSPAVIFEFKAPFKPHVDPNDQLKQAKAKPPTVWAEVFCKETETWICVDPIRGHINKPGLMEPAQLDRNNRISYIVAFEKVKHNGRGNCVDVTRRYTKNMAKALKERERPLTVREKQAGGKLWSEVFLNNLFKKNKLNERDLLEQEELELRQIDDVMPTSIGAFKNHALYALERHLKKMEVLYEKEPVLGYIKNEKIYARQCVRSVATADTYRKAGREVIEGEQPLKMVKTHAVTINNKRLKERARQEGNEMLVPCYGEWQTRLYVPPPIVNGKIIKNAFGNIDLFQPSMLPKGAAHIPIKGIVKMARKLGLDYADAVVDFEFAKMRSVPVINGVVVAEENRQILLEAWEEHDQNETMKAIAKQEKESVLRWRKLIKGLLIKARLDSEYSKDNNDVWAGYEDKGGGGGFLPEES